jgi:hypothetical protein
MDVSRLNLGIFENQPIIRHTMMQTAIVCLSVPAIEVFDHGICDFPGPIAIYHRGGGSRTWHGSEMIPKILTKC